MIKKLDNYNFFAKLDGNRLLLCETEKDGTVKYLDWKEPVSPDKGLLDAVNTALGTSFAPEDFSAQHRDELK